jgi:hypothetical protein
MRRKAFKKALLIGGVVGALGIAAVCALYLYDRYVVSYEKGQSSICEVHRREMHRVLVVILYGLRDYYDPGTPTVGRSVVAW